VGVEAHGCILERGRTALLRSHVAARCGLRGNTLLVAESLVASLCDTEAHENRSLSRQSSSPVRCSLA
jgi:hypothetical protein